MTQADAATKPEELIRRTAAAAFLGVSRDTLDAYRKAGVVVRGQTIRLPAVPIGARFVRYRVSDLEAFREALRVARDIAATPTAGPRPESAAEFARRAAADVEAFNRH